MFDLTLQDRGSCKKLQAGVGKTRGLRVLLQEQQGRQERGGPLRLQA